MKTGIVYFSRTGNTKRVADAIASAVPGEIVMGSMQEAPSLGDCELVFLGMPVDKFGAPKSVEPYVSRELAGRPVAVFVTHAANDDEPELQQYLLRCRDAVREADIVAFFDCQGEMDPRVAKMMMFIPGLRKFAKKAPESKGQPDARRLEAAREFARLTIASHAPVTVLR